MKINNLIDKTLAIYLVLSSSVSLLFLTVFVIGNKLTVIFLMPILISLILMLAIIYYNSRILFSYSISKQRALINSCAGLLQLPFLYMDGFQFKYNQGIQFIVYGKMFNGTSDFRLGFEFEKFSYLINIQFWERTYTNVGIDLLALGIFIFYLYQYNKLKNHSSQTLPHLQ